MSNMTLREFAARRRREIFQQIRALREELVQLKAIQAYATNNHSQQTSMRPSHALTFQEMIIEILCEQPNGATAKEILSLIEANFEKKIMRSSISPQLSRLKDKNVLSLSNSIWRLTSFGENLKKAGLTKQNNVLPAQSSVSLHGENELPLNTECGNGDAPLL